MIESLIQLDQNLFLIIHHGLKNDFFDLLMPLWRSKYIWIPLYVFLIGVIVQSFGRSAILIFIGLGITIALADNVSSQLIKKNIKRIRPCNTEVLNHKIESIVPCGSGYSFTSSHATNHFAIAVFLSIFLISISSWSPLILLIWASSVCFAQVYVGVHYPIDILAGALVGAIIGWIVSILIRKLFNIQVLS